MNWTAPANLWTCPVTMTTTHLSSVESSRAYGELWIVISILWSRSSPSSGVSRLASRSSTCGTGHGANCAVGDRETDGPTWSASCISITSYKGQALGPNYSIKYINGTVVKLYSHPFIKWTWKASEKSPKKYDLYIKIYDKLLYKHIKFDVYIWCFCVSIVYIFIFGPLILWFLFWTIHISLHLEASCCRLHFSVVWARGVPLVLVCASSPVESHQVSSLSRCP